MNLLGYEYAEMTHEFPEIVSKFCSVEKLIDSFYQLLKEPFDSKVKKNCANIVHQIIHEEA